MKPIGAFLFVFFGSLVGITGGITIKNLESTPWFFSVGYALIMAFGAAIFFL